MRKILITGLLELFILLPCCLAAQERPWGPMADMPTEHKNSCRQDPTIFFTEEQAKGFDSLQRDFLEQVKPLWKALKELRLDLHLALSGAQIPREGLIEKQKKVLDIQRKVESLRFHYLIKARALFTKEELERFPRGCPLKMGISSDRGSRLGRRFFQESIR